MELSVVGAQIDIVALDPEANLSTIGAVFAEIGPCDLVVLPELSNIGQVRARDRDFGRAYAAAATTVPGPFTDALGELAARHSTHVVAGVAERDHRVPGTIYNSAVVIAPSGDVVATQRKLHPAGEERHYFGTGDEIVVARTDIGSIAVALCYDVYFPEIPRTAALRGSTMLVGVFNVTHRTDWPARLTHLAAVRAYENMQHVILVNRVGENHGRRFGGGSAAARPPGMICAEARELDRALLRVRWDTDDVLTERAYRPVFADRRPELYDLTSPRRVP